MATTILDRADLAAFIKRSNTSIWRYMKMGLPHKRCGREVFFEKDKILKWERPRPGRPKEGGDQMSSKKEIIQENACLRDKLTETDSAISELRSRVDEIRAAIGLEDGREGWNSAAGNDSGGNVPQAA
jgi:hypothetical protein